MRQVIDYKGKMEGEVLVSIVPHLCGCLTREECTHEAGGFNSDEEDEPQLSNMIGRKVLYCLLKINFSPSLSVIASFYGPIGPRAGHAPEVEQWHILQVPSAASKSLL